MMAVGSLYVAFAEQARRFPERVAVSATGERITYAQLDLRARRIARRLLNRGVGPDTLVGLSCERGVSLIAGMLGILAAGGAYLPLDPAYPDDRISLLLGDSGIGLAVGSGAAARRLTEAGVRVVPADSQPDDEVEDESARVILPKAGPADMAYVIYTSGSTGVPKGVVVEHGSVLRLFGATAPWFGFDEHDVWTLFHSVSFDFSVWEVWGALLHGGRLVVVPQIATRVPSAFLALLAREGVTVLNQTPSAFRQLIPAAIAADGPALALRYVVFGGERLDLGALRPWLARYSDTAPQLVNMYGITETTVHVTYRPIRAADLAAAESSPIGVPIPDLAVTLHDPDGVPVPDGVPGEMWVSGPGVARGYLNRPQLTGQRFVTGPDGARAYRSGDLAVRTAAGELEVLGRVDDQIKVRGYRIEPGEVESCLCAHPDVAAAVVAPRDYGDGDIRLAAYVQPSPSVAADAEAEARLVEELRAHAADRLPAHLCPSNYELLGALPMTPHGKADRAALRRIGEAAAARAARDPRIDEAVAGIAQGVLRQGAVPADRDLFDLGATSLAFIRIIAEVNQEFGIRLTGAELDGTASVESVADAVAAALDAALPVPAIANTALANTTLTNTALTNTNAA
ncbi:MAG TPA: amino acid adenylation domain-containing protein [Actinocrinis sp.]|nr:amino acid adenylation domain-containing protein [Actinocrinis sp.]